MGKAEELAAAVGGLAQGKRKRRQYPSELRHDISRYVREQRAGGVPLKSIAQRIGVCATLLHRWEVSSASKFRRVELSAAPLSAGRHVLHAPHGVRIEDLAVDELVDILRRLG